MLALRIIMLLSLIVYRWWFVNKEKDAPRVRPADKDLLQYQASVARIALIAQNPAPVWKEWQLEYRHASRPVTDATSGKLCRRM